MRYALQYLVSPDRTQIRFSVYVQIFNGYLRISQGQLHYAQPIYLDGVAYHEWLARFPLLYSATTTFCEAAALPAGFTACTRSRALKWALLSRRTHHRRTPPRLEYIYKDRWYNIVALLFELKKLPSPTQTLLHNFRSHLFHK